MTKPPTYGIDPAAIGLPAAAPSLDTDLDRLVRKYGFNEVVAALARYANTNGLNPAIFRRLNKIYEWLVGTPD